MRATDGTRKISKTTRLVGGGVASVAAAAGLFAASATPAFASGYWETQTDGATGVSAWGTSTLSNDHCDISMHIKDTRADGHRAGVQVQVQNLNPIGTDNYYRYNTSGSGTTVDRSVYDITDNFDIIVYVREFVSEGAIESGGSFVDRGDWEMVC